MGAGGVTHGRRERQQGVGGKGRQRGKQLWTDGWWRAGDGSNGGKGD